MTNVTVARRAPVSTHPGFTMVELLITIVILAVLAGIAVPSMREFIARQRVEAIAKELATDLRYLRTEAIQRRRDVEILFLQSTDGATSCYVLYFVGEDGERCSCGRTDGLPTCGDPALPDAHQEFKTVSFRRTSGIVLSSNPTSMTLGGLNGLPRDSPTGPQAFRASVAGTSIGGEVLVYTTLTDRIVPKICSNSGRHGSLLPCTPSP